MRLSDWRNWINNLRQDPGLDAGYDLMKNCWRSVVPWGLLVLLLAGCGSPEPSWSSYLVGTWHGTTRVDKTTLAAALDPRPRDVQLDIIFADLESSEYRFVFHADGTVLFEVLQANSEPSKGRWQVTAEDERIVTVLVESEGDGAAEKKLKIQFVNPDVFHIHTGPESAPNAVLQKYVREVPLTTDPDH